MKDFGTASDAGATAHYADSKYYDHTYRDRSEDALYYARLGRLFRGPVLEYGIGTGRVAIQLARRGVEVVGVDSSPEMLRGLARRLSLEPEDVRRRITAVRGDMRKVRLRRRFPLVIAPFNVFQHLYDRPDVEGFLACVRAHLEPLGRFVFDVLVPDPADLGADPKRRHRTPRFRHPTTGDVVRYAERFDYDPLRQVLLVSLEFEPENGSPAFRVPLTHRQFFPKELEALLHYNGFCDVDIGFGFGEGSIARDSVVVTCRLAPRRAPPSKAPRTRGRSPDSPRSVANRRSRA